MTKLNLFGGATKPFACVQKQHHLKRILQAKDAHSVSEHGTAGSVMCEELEFYQSYEWCLNPYLTVSEAISHLRDEVEKLSNIPNGWQSSEVATNVFLLSCGVLNCIDEYLSGSKLRLPGRLATTAVGRTARRFVESMSVRPRSRLRVEQWRENWLESLNDFLLLTVRRLAVESDSLVEAGRKLAEQLKSPLPSDLQGKRINPLAHSVVSI
jgi:hypothetical protein